MAPYKENGPKAWDIQEALLEIPRIYTPGQRIVKERIHGPIETERFPFELNELSPTPLDPLTLMTHGVTYVKGAEILMLGRFDDRLSEIGITLKQYQHDAIVNEIITEHILQVDKNDASLHRLYTLFLSDPTVILPETADLIYMARIGGSTTIGRLEILSRHPTMQSIEDMKYTKPLDMKSITLAKESYYKSLVAISRTHPDFCITLLKPHEQPIRRVDVSKSADLGIVVTKKTIATATVNGVELLLKQRDSYFVFPLSQDLSESVMPNILTKEQERFNLQQISVSTYWTTKESEELDVPGEPTTEIQPIYQAGSNVRSLATQAFGQKAA